MFTCNPVSGDPSMVAINASWGLGSAVVEGEVTPDDYLLSKVTGEIVRERVSAKGVQCVPRADGHGTELVDVPEQRREQRCLDAPTAGGAGRRSPAGCSATSAPTRTSSGRSRTRASWPAGVSVVQSRPVTARRRAAAVRRGAAVGAVLVMNTFGVRPARPRGASLEWGSATTTSRRYCGSSTSPIVDELRVETEGFSLHVVRRGAAADGARPADDAPSRATRPPTGPPTISC